ncbi:hypothetical protein Dalk_4564 [Desulfatibacillum aliphaticivorans]|uniref:Uncharacterized protein n=1 Tax=Desulfatibacillum aliphaticivorans TaxID=218208 RepID=B8FNG1_DESAL|nr:hypothetical protein Dalk_4564 [Desulfatibacillum aliphaticivorans]
MAHKKDILWSRSIRSAWIKLWVHHYDMYTDKHKGPKRRYHKAHRQYWRMRGHEGMSY